MSRHQDASDFSFYDVPRALSSSRMPRRCSPEPKPFANGPAISSSTLDHGALHIGDAWVHEIRHEDLVSNVAVVLQETELFNLSLRDNPAGF
jgi:hypothetical protein